MEESYSAVAWTAPAAGVRSGLGKKPSLYVSAIWVTLFSQLNAYIAERATVKSANSLILQNLARR